MNLEDFIAETMFSITCGVGKGALKVDERLRGELRPKYALIGCVKESEVEFDVALTTKELSSNSKKSGVSIQIAGMGIGGKGEKNSEATNQSVSRVKFKVQFQKKPVTELKEGWNEQIAMKREKFSKN